MITAKVYDTFIPRGTSKDIKVQVLNEAGAQYDLTDHTVKAVLFTTWTDSTSKVLEKEAAVVNLSEGKVRLEFDPEDTKELVVRTYDLFVLVEYVDEVWTAFVGKLAVTPSGEVG